LRAWLGTALARLWRFWPESWYQSAARARWNIQFHYDMTIHEAQAAKLDYICRKLDLKPGERFLDIGCGFGALVIRAAQRFRARASGCTLSRRQFETAARTVTEQDLDESAASVEFADYRDLQDRFDKDRLGGHGRTCRRASLVPVLR
jgi:cyclopropane fatty-acyl-phospholipid synthase-like methyltransferase